MLITLSVRFFGQTKVSLILMQWSCVVKYCHIHAFSNFFLLFRVPPMTTSPTAPIHTDLCPSAPILDTFGYPPKTSCPGKFPRPYGPKPCPVYQHMLMLTLFSCPPAPTYPIAPIHTHLHPFTPICTLPNSILYCIYVLFMLI